MFCYSATIVSEQCHAMGLRLPFVSYTTVVAVASVGPCSFGLHPEAASPNPGAC
jgi:hypothetical protein